MPHGLFPPELATLHVESAGRQWTPSNNTEGQHFIESWCRQCWWNNHNLHEDVPFDEIDPLEGICQIFDASFRGEAWEWQIGADGQPRCTAYVPAGQPLPLPPPRCEHTLELPL